MTEFIIGPASCGKTTEIYDRIARALGNGRKVILLVPEQAALSAEAELTSLLQSRNVPQTDLEVLNFTRLCNRVFRSHGGISYNSVTRGAKALIMWDALFSSAPYLKYYNGIFEEADRFIPSLLSLVDEFKSYNVTPEALSKASEDALEENLPIADKLSDLSIVYGEYVRRVNASWDDPSDDLTRLAQLLKSEKFFNGIDVYLDSFKGFTPQQMSVLRHIFRQADNVTASFTMTNNDADYCFDNVKATFEKLKDMSDDGVKVTMLERQPSVKPDDLTMLCDGIWSYVTEDGCLRNDGSVNAVICDNVYKEVDYIASDIHKRLREGARYRDFAVISRSIEDYKGIIDTVFSRHGLPCRVFDAVQLSEAPLFKLVTSAINVRVSDYELNDIMIYIKTGLTSLTTEEIFKLERYAFTWNISGSQWTTEEKWYMNPNGYTDRLTESGRRLIDEVNSIRSRIMRPLLRLHEALDGSRTVKEVCKSIYDHIVDLGITEKLEEGGNDDEIRIFNCLIESLDIMANTIGSRRITAKLFLGLFSIVVSQASFGTLPSTIDEITIGSADLIRASGVKHAYVIGVNEECFPKAVSQNSFFSDNEKIYLETCGIGLSPRVESVLCDELYYFYKSISLPTISLTVTCVSLDKSGDALRRSVAFNRVAQMLGKDNVVIASKLSPSETVFTVESALHAAYDENTVDGKAIRLALSDNAEASQIINEPRQSFISDENTESISDEVMKKVYPNDMLLSQSKLEKIAQCAMGYQLNYTLGLKEDKRARFDAKDTGNLIHKIVEKFFARVTSDDGVPHMTDEEIDSMIDDILNDYLASIFGNRALDNVSKRAVNLFKRLRRTSRVVVKNLLEEFSQSKFVPRFFEMRIDNEDKEGTVKSIEFPLPDGSKAALEGYIDRVDVCKEGNKLYVRVVDYKTGTKKFDLEDVAMGINMQMLLYLFSIWKDNNGNFKKEMQFSGEIIPAGVLYLIAKAGSVSEAPTTDAATVYDLAAKNISRNGLLIKDEQILRLMEEKLEGKYIPIKISKTKLEENKKKNPEGDSYTKDSYKSLKSLEEMGALLNQITNTVTKLATEIKSGKSSCTPVRNKKHDSCKYCPYSNICRNPKSFIKMENY